jgi:hypothetical protein
MPAGRPTIMTPETLNKLEEAFLWGCVDDEACLYAGISHQTLYNYQEKHPEYVERKAMLKTNPLLQAKRIQSKALGEDDVAIAMKVIDRKEGSKVALTDGAGGPVHINIAGFSSVGS